MTEQRILAKAIVLLRQVGDNISLDASARLAIDQAVTKVTYAIDRIGTQKEREARKLGLL